ncbi:tropomodulin [Aplysia californica]|uniref:Tropomodulin n=1 Tax=Aplysia californica TaxID=6500 RepID=A0ABM1A2R0_APLCA|nr:tropomodulin [Aplysia californica]
MTRFVSSSEQMEDVPEVDLDNLDDLLNALSTEELEELNGDFDPDNSLLPPSQRCKDQTSKMPSGPFSRQKLLSFLEEKAKHEKDWENTVPYSKETKGE